MRNLMPKSRFHQSLTLGLLGVTVMLWGYLIGTFILEQRSDEAGFAGGAQFITADAMPNFPRYFGRLPNLLQNGPMPLMQDQHARAPMQPQGPNEGLMNHDHNRFALRDGSFSQRLRSDRKFLLENSF